MCLCLARKTLAVLFTEFVSFSHMRATMAAGVEGALYLAEAKKYFATQVIKNGVRKPVHHGKVRGHSLFAA